MESTSAITRGAAKAKDNVIIAALNAEQQFIAAENVKNMIGIKDNIAKNVRNT